MKILFITHFSVNDMNASSGTIYHIKRMLEKSGNEVAVVDNLHLSRSYKLLLKLVARMRNKKTLIEREAFILKGFARELKQRTKQMDYDIVFAPSSLYYTFYKDSKPMVFYTDATFGGMVDYYIYQQEYSKRAISNGFKQETMAIHNADLVIYASEWARRTAIELHDADADKCIVINRGANIKHSYSRDEIRRIIEARKLSNHQRQCDFMFFGTDWNRKGGPLACDIVKILNETYGIDAKLYVVGCTPHIPEEYDGLVEVIGFINKHNPTQYELLESTFKRCDFFLLPTRQEAQGISYAEACSWGMPVIGTNTGGVTGIVQDGVNGLVFETADGAYAYAARIRQYVENGKAYKQLAESAYDFFVHHLSWETVGSRINDALQEMLDKEVG